MSLTLLCVMGGVFIVDTEETDEFESIDEFDDTEESNVEEFNEVKDITNFEFENIYKEIQRINYMLNIR